MAKGKLIVLSLPLEPSATKEEAKELVAKVLKDLVNPALAGTYIKDGEWVTQFRCLKKDLTEIVARCMEEEGGPSVNEEEAREFAQEIWDASA